MSTKPINVNNVGEPPKGMVLCTECWNFFDYKDPCRYCTGELKKPSGEKTIKNTDDINYLTVEEKQELKRKKLIERQQMDYSVVFNDEYGKEYKLELPSYIPITHQRRFKKEFDKVKKHLPSEFVPKVVNFLKIKLLPLCEEYEQFLHLLNPSRNKKYTRLNQKMRKYILQYSVDFQILKNTKKRIKIYDYKDPHYRKATTIYFLKEEYKQFQEYLLENNLDEKEFLHDTIMNTIKKKG
jgi:hypothetical protein